VVPSVPGGEGSSLRAPMHAKRGEHRRDKGCVAENHREEVVEVMRDPARELAQTFQALSLL
jgi:hypothetical protein